VRDLCFFSPSSVVGFLIFVAPTCLVVVVVLDKSLGDVDCGWGVEKTFCLVVLHLVGVL
jgi:hypothetical protein